jgi:hypothetical protein
LQAIIRLYPDKFFWLAPPYEYEYKIMPIDILTGDPEIRRQLEFGDKLAPLAASWDPELAVFSEKCRDLQLYN